MHKKVENHGEKYGEKALPPLGQQFVLVVALVVEEFDVFVQVFAL